MMYGKRRNSGCIVGNLIWYEFVNCTQNSPGMCLVKITTKNLDQELVDLVYSNGSK